MRYIMSAGTLSVSGSSKTLAQIKSVLWGAKKIISMPDIEGNYQTDIDITNVPREKMGDVRYRVYLLKNTTGERMIEACPQYAENDDPTVVGWPVCRAPKVDHAKLQIDGNAYLLVMHNNQNYSLQDMNGSPVLQIMHKGLSGGWVMDTAENFTVQVLCGLFIFCRYIEQENEFIVV